MPMSTALSALSSGFLPMFRPETAPISTEQAARLWTDVYLNYALAGGILASPKRPGLLADLTVAFNPNLGGGGIALFLSALLKFWVGLPVPPPQLGTVVLFLPVGSVNSPQPPGATPEQQAQGLAQTIHALTLGAVKVQLTAPPNLIVPII